MSIKYNLISDLHSSDIMLIIATIFYVYDNLEKNKI